MGRVSSSRSSLKYEMFNRRQPKPFHHKILDLIWPRMGLHRTFRYYWLRLIHHPASSRNLAAAFATGAAVSCTPFLGLHLIFAFGICFFLRLNLWSAALGTVFGNPWTFPFIWSFTYFIGSFFVPFSLDSFDLEGLTWSFLIENPWRIFFPMLIGSIPLSALVWVCFYKALNYFLKKHKRNSK